MLRILLRASRGLMVEICQSFLRACRAVLEGGLEERVKEEIVPWAERYGQGSWSGSLKNCGGKEREYYKVPLWVANPFPLMFFQSHKFRLEFLFN